MKKVLLLVLVISDKDYCPNLISWNKRNEKYKNFAENNCVSTFLLIPWHSANLLMNTVKVRFFYVNILGVKR